VCAFGFYLPVLLFAALERAKTELAGCGRGPAAFPAAAARPPADPAEQPAFYCWLVFITSQALKDEQRFE
jgi:hypothetical protein